MTNKLHLKTRMLKTSILATIMFTHTGCFFGYFGNQTLPMKKPIPRASVQHNTPVMEEPTIPTPQRTQPSEPIFTEASSAPVSVSFNTPPPVVECSDDVNSNCNKPPIEVDELKPKVQTSTGGEVHKLRSIQGKNITIVERSNGFVFPDYRNKVVVLEMFGKNCPYCMKEIPSLNRLKQRYRGDIEVIAVQVEDKMTPSEAKRLIQRHNIHYPIIPGDTATNLQYNIQNTYGWTGILPFTMIIKDGVTEFTYPGAVSYSELNKAIGSIAR